MDLAPVVEDFVLAVETNTDNIRFWVPHSSYRVVVVDACVSEGALN